MISLSRTRLSGICLLICATCISVHEYKSQSNLTLGPSSELLPSKAEEATPTDLTQLAEQISFSEKSDDADDGEKEKIVQISSGDTIMSIFDKVGISKEEAFRAIVALRRVYDLRDLKVGQEINMRYRKNAPKGESALLSLAFKASHDNEIILSEDSGEFLAKKYQIALKKIQKRVHGKIDSSFYSAALKSGVPPQVVREAINALAYDINWQHDPVRGDPWTIVYDVYQDTNGNVVRADNLKFVSFAPGGKKANVRSVYRYQPAKGSPGYYNSDGKSVVRTLLQTPMDPSKMRVTSKFGRRRHPCLGYTRHHKGVDFGAPTGTPVRAAGNGVIVRASRYGNYGNYIMIKHNREYSTAYAHLSRMKVKVGQVVKQNQIIGNVGATGRTTGPHLHYEVLYKGVHVNPQGIKLLPTQSLSTKDLALFKKVKHNIEKEMHQSPLLATQVASAAPRSRQS